MKSLFFVLPLVLFSAVATEAACPPVERGQALKTLKCLPQLEEIELAAVAKDFAPFEKTKVVVAVIDHAINADHPDLAKAVTVRHNFNICPDFDSHDGSCERIFPKREPPKGKGPPPVARFHGTMVSGLIAGRGTPSVGVNPSAELWALVGDPREHNRKALEYAIQMKADVVSINWPLGPPPGKESDEAFKKLLEKAAAQGTVVVMAAGNRSRDVNAEEIYPTRYSSIPGVIAVGALHAHEFDKRFSNFGTKYVDLAAPGTVLSTANGSGENAYLGGAGSSFAGPLVAGAVSRVIQFMKACKIPYKAAEVEKILLEGSPTGEGLKKYVQGGHELNMPALWKRLHALAPKCKP